MIAETTLILFIIGLLCGIKTGVKADKLLSFLSFTAVFFIFAYFSKNLSWQNEDVFSFVWNSSPAGDIKVDIISNSYNHILIFPFFLMTLLAVGFNVVFCFEERRNLYNAVLLFNLVSLIMMITSNNFVQLLAGLFFVDILALIIVRNTENMQYYITFNIVADMILFLVLALINSQVHSLEIEQINQYKQLGKHVDFIAALGAVAVFIKLGFAPFQLNFLSLRDSRFHRLQSVLFLTAPAVALILLLKFSPLWNDSVYFSYFIMLGKILTLICGCGGLLFVDNVRAKLVYLQMIFAVLFIHILQNKGFIWSMDFSKLLIVDYLVVCSFYFIYFYSNRKKTMSQLENTAYVNSIPMYANILLALLAILLLNDILIKLFFAEADYFIVVWMGAFLLAWTNFLRQSFVFAEKKVGKYLESSSVRIGFWIMMAAVLYFMLPNVDFKDKYLWVCEGSVLVLLLIHPLKKWSDKVYESDKWQNNMLSEKLYSDYLAQPLLYCGRVLWLLVDWVLVEKFIVGAVTGCLQVFIRLFRNFHNNKVMASVVTLIVLLLLLYCSFISGGKTIWRF